MAKEISNRITDWNVYYEENENEDMPWYSKKLDNDIKNELEKRKIISGKILDIGTGPGTQATALSELGFDVTGTDISENAVEKVKNLNTNVRYIQDDILNTKLNEQFDYIIDRGCFHVMKPDLRYQFVFSIIKLLKQGGLYFLKCFSNKQEGSIGPQRISPDDINKTFGKYFIIHSIDDTVFDGERSSMPKALFVVMEKK